MGQHVTDAFPEDHVKLVSDVVWEVRLLALEGDVDRHALRNADPHEVLQSYPQAGLGLGAPKLAGELPHQLYRFVGSLWANRSLASALAGSRSLSVS